MHQNSEPLRLKEKGDQTLGNEGSLSKVVLALKIMSTIKAD